MTLDPPVWLAVATTNLRLRYARRSEIFGVAQLASFFNNIRRHQPSAMRSRDYQGAGWIGLDPDALIEIPRIANAIGNAAAQSSAMTQNARGPRAP
jgi:hypothetical protein